MLWPLIKYPMYSFQSTSDWILFIPHVKARIYIWFAINFNIIESPRETKRSYSRNQNGLYAVARKKVPYVFLAIKVSLDNIFPRRVKARLCIYSSQLNSIGTNPHAKQNDVIGELKTRYMLWPAIKYPMYSLQSKSDWIIFISRRVKIRLYT
jgi:hypothetical protein